MIMSLHKIDGIILICGSIFFLIAAFSPISWAVFPESDPAKKLELITNGMTSWIVTQTFFALGAIITALGLSVTAYHLRGFTTSGLVVFVIIAVVLGASLWSWSMYQRMVDPATFTSGTPLAWQFMAYSLLTQFGLVAMGVINLQSGLPNWVGWLYIGGGILFFVGYLVFKDMPPFVYYLVTLIGGIMMYRMA